MFAEIPAVAAAIETFFRESQNADMIQLKTASDKCVSTLSRSSLPASLHSQVPSAFSRFFFFLLSPFSSFFFHFFFFLPSIFPLSSLSSLFSVFLLSLFLLSFLSFSSFVSLFFIFSPIHFHTTERKLPDPTRIFAPYQFESNAFLLQLVEKFREVFGKDWQSKKFAVRSSAVGEDSEEMSAAGQMTTFLGMKGKQEISSAVVDCWASQFALTGAGKPITETPALRLAPKVVLSSAQTGLTSVLPRIPKLICSHFVDFSCQLQTPVRSRAEQPDGCRSTGDGQRRELGSHVYV